MPTILITGANRGIGLALTNEYLARGWRVIAACRAPEQATALREAAQDRLSLVTIDVRDVAAIEAAAASLDGVAIDVVCNNAGINAPNAPLSAFDPATWHELLSVNVLGPIAMTRAFLPHLERGEHKKLANITSGGGSITNCPGDRMAYRSSKTALNMAMKCLAIELRPRGISVGIFSPGFVATDMSAGVTGPGLITPAVSAQGLATWIEALTLETSAEFRRYNGDLIAW